MFDVKLGWAKKRKPKKVFSLHHERNEWKMSSLKKWQNYNTRNKRCFVQIRLSFCWAEWKIWWNITYVDECCWVEVNSRTTWTSGSNIIHFKQTTFFTQSSYKKLLVFIWLIRYQQNELNYAYILCVVIVGSRSTRSR